MEESKKLKILGSILVENESTVLGEYRLAKTRPLFDSKRNIS